MAYDALKETTPSRSSKEYLKILKLAAEAGEVQVDGRCHCQPKPALLYFFNAPPIFARPQAATPGIRVLSVPKEYRLWTVLPERWGFRVDAEERSFNA